MNEQDFNYFVYSEIERGIRHINIEHVDAINALKLWDLMKVGSRWFDGDKLIVELPAVGAITFHLNYTAPYE